MASSIAQKLILLAAQQPSVKPELLKYMASLTQQELKVLIFLTDDLTTKEIAELMYITPKSVANYKARITEKLHLESGRALRRFAILHQDTLKVLRDF